LNKKYIIVSSIASVGILSAIYIGFFGGNTQVEASANEIASKALDKLKVSGVEHIKTTSKFSKTDHYRDVKGSREVSIEYRSDGSLIKKTIVDKAGERVTVVGPEIDGKREAYTWTLPKDIAEENKGLLKASLLDEIKKDLDQQSWTLDESVKTKEQAIVLKQVKKDNNENNVVKVYTDSKTSFPKKKETYQVVDGSEELVSTEEYSIESDNDSVFDTSKISPKEIPAPVTPEATKKGN
jgi:hypothetical protein